MKTLGRLLFSCNIQVYIQPEKEVKCHYKCFGTFTKNDLELVIFTLNSAELPKDLE